MNNIFPILLTILNLFAINAKFAPKKQVPARVTKDIIINRIEQGGNSAFRVIKVSDFFFIFVFLYEFMTCNDYIIIIIVHETQDLSISCKYMYDIWQYTKGK